MALDIPYRIELTGGKEVVDFKVNSPDERTNDPQKVGAAKP